MKQYAYSLNEEDFHGNYDTEAEAILEGFDGTNRAKIWVGECKPPTPAEELIDSDTILEAVTNCDEYWGEWAQDWPNATHEQLLELTTDVRKAFSGWMDKHNLRPAFFTVPEVKEVPRPADMPIDPDCED